METHITNSLSRTDLDVIERKVIQNEATSEQYRLLDAYIHSLIGVENYLLSKLNNEGIRTYDDFIEQRKRSIIPSDIVLVQGYLVGIVKGAIKKVKSLL